MKNCLTVVVIFQENKSFLMTLIFLYKKGIKNTTTIYLCPLKLFFCFSTWSPSHFLTKKEKKHREPHQKTMAISNVKKSLSKVYLVQHNSSVLWNTWPHLHSSKTILFSYFTWKVKSKKNECLKSTSQKKKSQGKVDLYTLIETKKIDLPLFSKDEIHNMYMFFR